MRTRIAALACFILLGLGLVLIGRRPAGRESRLPVPASTRQTPPHTPLSSPAPLASAPGPTLPPALEEWWTVPSVEPEFAQFADWTHRYAASATPGAKAALEAEGVALARARLTALANLVQSNPERALELGVPSTVRGSLPGSVQAWLEHPVNARGNLEVIAFRPFPGQERSLTPVLRYAEVEGERSQVFAYGHGLEFITKSGVPLHGLRVPADAATRTPPNNGLPPAKFLMALHESPARRLDPAEIWALRQAQAQEPVCGTSGQPWLANHEPAAVELAGEIKTFCGKVHAEDWAQAQVAAAGMDLPGGGGGWPTSESSYTEGRKRMLLLRPYWTDYAGMATNDALTHWVGFSNYMFQLSYGKLVLAPLGKGSAISTEIVLAGSVANYSSGLGSAPSTWGAVRTAAAAAPYNYVLGDYDFVYYCTRSQPAASYAGLGFVGGVGFHLANSYFDAATSSHEFGHNLGLNHANFWETTPRTIIGTGSSVEYGDGNDPMGGGGNPNQYGSRYKNYLGWIPDSDVANLNTTGNGTYRLYAFDLDNSTTGLRGLKFTRSGSQNYWVQFRQRKTGTALQNGVQLLWTGNGNQSSLLLDPRLTGGSSDNALVIGRTFSDTSVNFHVTPIGKGHTVPESMDVVVNIGTFAANQPPVCVVSASSTNVSAGQPLTFTATATDPNGDALARYWEFGDGAYSTNNSATASHSFAAGEYVVQCTVSDMKGGVARDSVLVRVGSPATFRISGRVFTGQNRALSGIKVAADATHSALTDSDGAYTITGLGAGSYTLDALEPVTGTTLFIHPFFANPVTVGPSALNCDFIVGTPVAPLTVMAAGATWKYLDNGIDQGTAWVATNFNDTAWASGAAQLGYGEDDETTVISYGPDDAAKYTTTYFRRAFTVTNTALYTNVTVNLLRDDGAIVYLNGVEVFRSNMPTGTVSYATFSSSSQDAQTFFSSPLPAGALRAGTNFLAAELHQSAPDTSDASFDLSITAESATNMVQASMVYLTYPEPGASFTAPTNLTLAAAALITGGTFTNVEFFDGATKLGEDAAAPHTQALNNPSNGAHTLTAVAVTSGGIRRTSPPVVITVSQPVAPPQTLALVPQGATWRYAATASAQPATWLTTGFNDAAWSSGPAQLGFGEGDEATTVPGGPAATRYATIYFRHNFIAADPAAITQLTLNLKRDDGAVVHLNGTELLRDNMPTGTISYGTLATASATDDGANFLSFDVDPDLLRVGTNLLAIEIHQSALDSSDLSFDLGLSAVISTNRPRGCWLVAPADGATIPLPGAVRLTAEAVAGGTLGVNLVEFYADGAKIGQTVARPFHFDWASAVAGPRVLTAVATDSAGVTITSAPVSITISPPPAGLALISFGELWKYRDEGTDPGTTWRNRIYNDSQWAAGPARLGYGGDGELTAVSFGTNANNKYITTYFRRAFVLPNPAVLNRLLLRLTRDDGAAVYLNGTEILRDNLQAGLVSWNSTALATIDAPAETAPLELVVPTASLFPGTNVVAVEIHQSSITSSDLGFDLSLTGLDDTNTTFGIYLTSPGAGARFNAPASVPLSAFAAAPLPISLIEYFAGPTKVGQSAVPPYVATWAGPSAGTHVLTARATYGDGFTLTSPPVSIVVGPPPQAILPVFTTFLQPATGPWKYWDSAASAGSGWQSPSFSDAHWPAANTRFGWGLDGEMSPLNEGRVTHYFRRWFNVANGGQLAELLLYLVRDDGAVVYLNGVEVFRSNLPAGVVDAGTLASTSVNTPEETTWFSTVLATAGSGLQSSNLIAVELHQSSASSSDASFDFALYAQGTTERRVYLGSPAQNSSYQNTAGIPIEAFALAGAGLSVARVELLADGNEISESTTPPYRMVWYGATFGPHTLIARLTDNQGGTMDSAPITVNVTRELVTTTLIPSNSVWKYFDGGVSQGTNWVGLNFNDSTWASGPARLGFGGDGEATLLNGGPSNARFPTTYFRHKFTIPAGVVYTNLLFKLVRDDGAVVHLNGREGYRDNMLTGTITYASYSAAGTTDEQAFFATNIVITNLTAGTNIVAVEVHQANATSGDLGFNLELIASGYLEDITPPVATIVLSDGMVEISWPGTYTGWRVYGAATVDAPPAGWQPLAVTPVLASGRYVVTLTPAGSAQFFRLGRP